MNELMLPAGLGRARPRDVRLTAGGRSLAVVIVLLLAAAPTAGILMYRAAIAQREDQRLLVEASSVTDGIVLRLWRDNGEKKAASVSYVFDSPRGRVQGQARLPLARWQSLRVGDRLAIRFVDADPARNIPDGVWWGTMPLILPFLAAFAFAATAAGCLFGVRWQQKLLRDGRVAQATVTQLHTHHSSHGGKHRSMSYEFPLMNGAIAKGKCSTSSKPPAVGSDFLVIYDPEKPKRSSPYPFSLVRPAEFGSP